MGTKEFDQLSNEHFGVKTGTKFKSIKFHHEVQGDLEEGTELVLDAIAHYPTRYLFKDENGRVWTLPIHSVREIIADEDLVDNLPSDNSSLNDNETQAKDDELNEEEDADEALAEESEEISAD